MVNKSEQIRQLFDQGYSVAEIARKMGIRYQYAYNVVSYYIKQKEMQGAKKESTRPGNKTAPK